MLESRLLIHSETNYLANIGNKGLIVRKGGHGCLVLGLKLEEVTYTGLISCPCVRFSWIIRVLFDIISKILGEGEGKIRFQSSGTKDITVDPLSLQRSFVLLKFGIIKAQLTFSLMLSSWFLLFLKGNFTARQEQEYTSKQGGHVLFLFSTI